MIYYIQENWIEEELDEIYIQILHDYLDYGLCGMFIKPKRRD